MALSGTTVFEIRATATANNVNGGGFNVALGGTDYTLQDAAQLAITDLTSVLASTTITSATGGFTSVMVGNLIHITSGTNFTAGWYEIVTYTDGNNVVIDRACTTGSNGSVGVAKVGGAMSLNSTLDDDLFELGLAGMIYYIKAGTYTLGENVAASVSGSASNPIKIIGYNATRGDNPTGSNRPLINMSAMSFGTQSNWDMYNIRATGTAAGVLTTNAGSKFVNCSVLNKSTTAGRVGFNYGSDSVAIDCEAVSYLGLGIDLGQLAFGCYVHHCANGIDLPNGTNPTTVNSNIISSCRTTAISNLTAQTGLGIITNNTLYGSEDKYGIGMNLPTGVTDKTFMNNIVYGFVTGVAHADTQSVGYDDYNDYFNNTNDVSAAGQWQKGLNDVAINPGFASLTQILGTTGRFVSGGSTLIDTSKNFSALGIVAGVDIVHIRSGTGVTEEMAGIASISTTTNPNDTLNLDINPGADVTADKVYSILLGHNFAVGVALKATGFPGAFPAGLTTGYMDIGAVQRQEPAGGSSGPWGMIR